MLITRLVTIDLRSWVFQVFSHGTGWQVRGLPGLLVREQAALSVLGVHIPPVGQDEGQAVQAGLQQTPQMLRHKLVPLFREVQSVRQVHRVVLGNTRYKRGQNSLECVYACRVTPSLLSGDCGPIH